MQSRTAISRLLEWNKDKQYLAGSNKIFCKTLSVIVNKGKLNDRGFCLKGHSISIIRIHKISRNKLPVQAGLHLVQIS